MHDRGIDVDYVITNNTTDLSNLVIVQQSPATNAFATNVVNEILRDFIGHFDKFIIT